MSEESTEKTEEPTAKRLEEARKEGNVPFSQDLGHWFGLFSGLIILSLLAPYISTKLINILRRFLDLAYDVPLNDYSINHFIFIQVMDVFKLISYPLLVVLFFGIFQKISQSGLVFSTKPFELDIHKLSPTKGLKKYITLKFYVEFFKNLVKCMLVGWIAYIIFNPKIQKLSNLPELYLGHVMIIIRALLIKIFSIILSAYLIIAIIDYAYQRYTYRKDLYMTKQKIKEEYKETEGDPQIKSRIKQLRVDRMRHMLITTVPKATVVITNPTHLAIALEYTENMPAPKVTAKGKNELAIKIKELALEYHIPIIENQALARSLYEEVLLEQYIPYRFFRAVAEIISFFEKRKRKHTRKPKPIKQ